MESHESRPSLLTTQDREKEMEHSHSHRTENVNKQKLPGRGFEVLGIQYLNLKQLEVKVTLHSNRPNYSVNGGDLIAKRMINVR